MINIDHIPTPQEIKTEISLLRDKLLAFTGISVDILEFAQNTIRVRVEQKELRNSYILNQAQLVARAAVVLSPLNNAFRIHYVVLTFKPDLQQVSASWIKEKMQEFKLSKNDLVKQLALDKTILIDILSGTQLLSDFQKAAFFYYFLTFDLNRSVRENDLV